METEKLGRFGHHPDPAIDYCVEVEAIGGMTYDACAEQAMPALAEVSKRIDRAMDFRVGGDKDAVGAKHMLRVCERMTNTWTLATQCPEYRRQITAEELKAFVTELNS